MRMDDNPPFQAIVHLLHIVVIVVAAGDFPLPAFIVGVDIAGTTHAVVGVALLEAVAEVVIGKRRPIEAHLLAGVAVLRGVDAVAGPRVRHKAAERYLDAERQLLVGRLSAVRIITVAVGNAVADAIDIAVPAGAEGALVTVLMPVILLVAGNKERTVAADTLGEIELEFLPLVVCQPPAIIAIRA